EGWRNVIETLYDRGYREHLAKLAGDEAGVLSTSLLDAFRRAVCADLRRIRSFGRDGLGEFSDGIAVLALSLAVGNEANAVLAQSDGLQEIRTAVASYRLNMDDLLAQSAKESAIDFLKMRIRLLSRDDELARLWAKRENVRMELLRTENLVFMERVASTIA